MQASDRQLYMQEHSQLGIKMNWENIKYFDEYLNQNREESIVIESELSDEEPEEK